ncbi:MAG: hypothetical protein O2816_01745 [Planctomycetota bacterium]|nr:hypothetical protein [Planctomycetota bacterium]
MLSLILLAAPCASQDSTEPAITAGDLSARIKILASDEFEGRGPASPGEEKTVAYLIEQVQRAGLAPGNGDSFVQEVPLVSTRPTEKPEVSIDIDGEAQDFVFGRDVMIVSPRPNASLDTRGAELVFCGFGVPLNTGGTTSRGWTSRARSSCASSTTRASRPRTRSSFGATR